LTDTGATGTYFFGIYFFYGIYLFIEDLLGFINVISVFVHPHYLATTTPPPHRLTVERPKGKMSKGKNVENKNIENQNKRVR
jgi:hypothetical protein